MIERLQKYMAHAGIASRRQAEQLILEGRVRVNGQVVTQLGTKVDGQKDFVKVDGKLARTERLVYLLMNKPKNTICTLDDPQQRVQVTSLLKGVRERVYPVGRLDFDTTGALLLTNDGDLANLLIHPRHGVSRTYVAKVRGIPEPDRLEKLRQGVFVDGRRTAPAEVRVVGVKDKSSLLMIVLHEGRNQQVKRMCLAIGHPCQRLTRAAFGFLTVQDMPAGGWRHLSGSEVERLKNQASSGAENKAARRTSREKKSRATKEE